jgi:putative DNA primase/helicase
MAHGYEGTVVQRQFEAAMLRRGLVPPQRFIADGKIRRCNTKQRNGRGDGSYLLHLDGAIPAGGFQNWQDGLGWENWHFNPGRELTAAERVEINQKTDAAAKERDETNSRNQAKAADKAQRLWDSAAKADQPHAYLQRKGIAPHGARLKYGCLLIPVFDQAGTLANLQFIRPDGSKSFLKGGRVEGCSYRIPGDPVRICIVEGFATGATIAEITGATVIVAFNAGNLLAVAEAVSKTAAGAGIIVCADDDWKRKGNPGLAKARAAARTIGARLAVPSFGVSRRDRDTDFNDLAGFIGAEAVKRCIDAATTLEGAPESDCDAEISRLAKLDGLAYARVRKDEAKKLGVTVGALDKAVAAGRSGGGQPSGAAYAIWRVEPWPDPVDGAKLLDAIARRIAEHVKLPKYADTTIALWILFAWTHDAFDISPLLTFSSPTHRCGKTTALKLLRCLVPRPMPAINLSGPVAYRAIEAWQPTLLCDEADKVFAANDDLRIIFNSGHDRDMAGVPRCEGDDHMPRVYSTWAPKTIGLIGQLPGTMADRSIVAPMQRKPRSEKVVPFRSDDDSLRELRSQCARWAGDHIDALRQSRPSVAEVLNDRDADNWRSLLAVAEAAGGDWPQRARDAALALSGAADGSDEIGIRLLRDIQSVCAEDQGRIEDRISTDKLIARLTADPERPWVDFHRGKPITANQLGKLLRRFGLASQNLRFDDGTQAKGYNLRLFADVWQRYLDDAQTSSSADFATSSRPAVPNAVVIGISPTFSSRPSEALGRRAKVQEVQHPSHLGRRDGCLRGNAAGNGAAVSVSAPPACSHCGRADGRVQEHGIDGETFWLHSECEGAFGAALDAALSGPALGQDAGNAATPSPGAAPGNGAQRAAPGPVCEQCGTSDGDLRERRATLPDGSHRGVRAPPSTKVAPSSEPPDPLAIPPFLRRAPP